MRKSFSDHFSAVSSSYAKFRPTYPAELYSWLASLTPDHSAAWDCAAGSGQASVDLAAHFDRVIATDASQAQIDTAVAHPRVDYRVASAEASGLPERSVDLVTVAQALHWFELDAFYDEVRRVLKPAGVLAAWSYGVATVEGCDVDAIAQRFYRETVGPYWPPETAIVEAGYRTLPFPFEEIEPPPFAMTARWTLPQLLGYFGSWSATARYIAMNGKDPTLDLMQQLAPFWGGPERIRTVTWRIALRAGRS
jgi:ubiquinone/menaquinone biosynthesis C-methylase UbiE